MGTNWSQSKEDSKESGVSLKRHRPKHGVIDFKDRVSLSRSDLSSYLMDNPVADDEDLVKSSYSLEDSKESGVSLKSDGSHRLTNFNIRVSLSVPDLSSYKVDNPVADDRDWFKYLYRRMALRRSQSDPVTRDFDIPLRQKNPLWVRPKKSMFAGMGKRGRRKKKSQGRTAHVKETPPSPKEKPEDLIGADINSVRDDEDWVESSDHLLAKGSIKSIDSGVSLKSDRSKAELIYFNKGSLLREEMNQELSSEVG